MNTIRSIVFLAAIIACLGCAACATGAGGGRAGPAEPAAEHRCPGFGESSPYLTGAHPRYPRSHFMTGGGKSCSSMEEAEKAAIRKISEEINSELTGLFESTISQISKKNQKGKTWKVVENIISKTRVKTRFKHRHLIKIVDRRQEGKTNGALAALDRSLAAEYLEPKVRHAGKRFDKLVDQCKAAYAQGSAALLARLLERLKRAAPQADKKLLEYAVITKQAKKYNRESPWRDMADLVEMQDKLRNQQRWFVHVASALDPARAHVRQLVPTMENRLRRQREPVAPLAMGPLPRALQDLEKRHGKDPALVKVLSCNVRGRVSSFPAGGNDRLYICVCSADLTARRLGSGRTLLSVQLEEVKGGGGDANSACRECVELLRTPLGKKIDAWIREAR